MSRFGAVLPITTGKGPGFQTVDGRWCGILESPHGANEHFHFERN
jgi:hypothetical protein